MDQVSDWRLLFPYYYYYYYYYCFNNLIFILPGLEGGHTNQPQLFTVETRGAGQGGLGLAIEGPSEAKMNCRDNRDGSCTVEYLPTKAGDYDISIKFADQDIPSLLEIRVLE